MTDGDGCALFLGDGHQFVNLPADRFGLLHVVQKNMPSGGGNADFLRLRQSLRTAGCVGVDEVEGMFLQGGEHHPHGGRIRGESRSHVIVGTGCVRHGAEHPGHFLAKTLGGIAYIQGIFAWIPGCIPRFHRQMEENLAAFRLGQRGLLRGKRPCRQKRKRQVEIQCQQLVAQLLMIPHVVDDDGDSWSGCSRGNRRDRLLRG